jgi:hypothetical protein
MTTKNTQAEPLQMSYRISQISFEGLMAPMGLGVLHQAPTHRDQVTDQQEALRQEDLRQAVTLQVPEKVDPK